MSVQPSIHHTDQITKGGQLFSHLWRMRFQNLQLTLYFFVGTFLLASCTLLAFTFGKYFYYAVIDVYGCGYLLGHIKMFLVEPFKTYFVEPLNSIHLSTSKMMNAKDGPLEWMRLTPTTLTTEVYIPQQGRSYMWWTHQFVKADWVLANVQNVHRCLAIALGCALTVALSMSYLFKRRGKKLEQSLILDGQECVSEEALGNLTKKQKSSIRLSKHLSYLKGTETEHTLLVGSTGQGKTNRMLDLMTQLRAQGKRAVVLDITGEFTSVFFREGKDKLLNPLDSRCAPWNIWGENLAFHEYDSWAASMVPENGRDPIWHDMARRLLSVTAQRLEDSPTRSMRRILEHACWAPLNQKTEEFYENSGVSAIMKHEAERTASSMRMTLASSVSPFEYLDEEGESFSITKWMAEDNDEWLFLTALPSQRSTLAGLLASWFNFAFLGLERCGPNRDRQVWFIIDELPGLRYRVDALPRMVAEGRKYGACCVFGFQNKSQLDHLFGQHDSKAIISNCSTKIIFRTPEAQTADYISNTLGRVEVQDPNENLSIGSHQMRDGINLNQQRHIKQAVTTTEIMNLDRFEAFVSLPGNFPVAKVKFDLFKAEKTTEGFIQRKKTPKLYLIQNETKEDTPQEETSSPEPQQTQQP